MSFNSLMPYVRRLLRAAAMSILVGVLAAACAAGPSVAAHGFSFDGRFDRWANQVDLLEYSYGDQYRMVRDKVKPGRESLPYQTNVNGAMPVGEFLFVKWRIKKTGEVVQDRVDLRGLLPLNMFDHKITYVIDDHQLYVYLVTPTPRNSKEDSPLRTYLARYTVTHQIYPTTTMGGNK